MKTASDALIAFLLSADQCRIVDLYTLTLWGGTSVRWSAGDTAIFANGHNFALGPAIDRSRITSNRGVTPSELEVTLYATPDDLVAGAPLIPYLIDHGLDGASVRIDRAYLRPGLAAPVGTLQWFSGRVTKIASASRTQATLNAADWRVLFNVNMPTALWQPGCRHALFDAGCALSPSAFAIDGTVSGSAAVTAFATSLTQAAGYFDQGYLTFTSGANTGIARTIKRHDGAGGLTLILALPNTPAVGDAFVAYPGCDLTRATCGAKFANLQHYGGEDYVPVPEVAVGF